MIIERLTFHVKYGQGDALLGVIREFSKKFASELTGSNNGFRVCTDQTGPMFTVVWDTEFRDIASWAEFEVRSQSIFAREDWQAWFAKMQPLVERGERQLLSVVDM